jgi:nucleoside-diphosphate-sugar epimerase
MSPNRLVGMASDILHNAIIGTKDPILVTGAGGFIGPSVVQKLLEYGFQNIRCLARSAGSFAKLEAVASSHSSAVELIKGNLLSPDDCLRAAKGVMVIYHLAAGTEKSFAGAFMNSVLTTRNLVETFLKNGQPKRFLNVSSFAVYSNLKLQRGALLDENCPLEDSPQERFDPYGYAKLKQDELIIEYGRQRHLPYVIVRPGAVFGPGKPKVTGRVAIDTFGFLIHLGGSNRLPLTYVDNCAEAIVLAGLKPGVEGEVFNVVDDDAPTSREFLRAYKKQTGLFSLPLPYSVTELLCAGWEKYSRATRNQLPPVFNRRRCAAEWKGNCYSNRKLKERLGWQPRVSMKHAMSSFLAQFTYKNP